MERALSVIILAFCTLAAEVFSTPQYTTDADVVVVGAGLSGLWAAHEMQKHGLKVIVLEGRGRVGGRTETIAPGTDDSIDLGAHWIGTSQYHVLEVMKQLGKSKYQQFVTGTKVLEMNGKVSHYKATLPTLPLLQELNFGLFYLKAGSTAKHIPRGAPYNYSHAKYYDGMTVETFCSFPVSKDTAQLIAASMRTVFGKEVSEVSALEYLHYAACAGGLSPLLDASPGGGQEFKIVGGTQSLSIALAQDLDVRLNTTVVVIDATSMAQEKLVSVKSLDGRSFTARRVVVAVPPQLAAGIWYTPVLPANKAHLLSRMSQGHLIKTVITYDKAFWRERGFSGEVVSSAFPLSICYDDMTPKGTAALVCFVGARDARRLSPVSLSERQDAVIGALTRYFGDDAKQFSTYLERDWGLEDFTGGCPVGSMNAGTITQWGKELRAPHGPVHFGGTETATWWYGFMNGAIQAGERCAIEVLEALGHKVPQEMRDFYNMGGVKERGQTPIFM